MFFLCHVVKCPTENEPPQSTPRPKHLEPKKPKKTKLPPKKMRKYAKKPKCVPEEPPVIPSSDPLEEWIRQKNITSRFFDLNLKKPPPSQPALPKNTPPSPVFKKKKNEKLNSCNINGQLSSTKQGPSEITATSISNTESNKNTLMLTVEPIPSKISATSNKESNKSSLLLTGDEIMFTTHRNRKPFIVMKNPPPWITEKKPNTKSVNSVATAIQTGPKTAERVIPPTVSNKETTPSAPTGLARPSSLQLEIGPPKVPGSVYSNVMSSVRFQAKSSSLALSLKPTAMTSPVQANLLHTVGPSKSLMHEHGQSYAAPTPLPPGAIPITMVLQSGGMQLVPVCIAPRPPVVPEEPRPPPILPDKPRSPDFIDLCDDSPPASRSPSPLRSPPLQKTNRQIISNLPPGISVKRCEVPPDPITKAREIINNLPPGIMVKRKRDKVPVEVIPSKTPLLLNESIPSSSSTIKKMPLQRGQAQDNQNIKVKYTKPHGSFI